MKEQRDILIITGSSSANGKTLNLLSDAGIYTDWREEVIPDEAKAIALHEGRVFWCNSESDMFDGEIHATVFAACVLTPELVATFPGAKEQPKALVDEDGNEYKVVGDCKKTEFKRGEYFLSFYDGVVKRETENFNYRNNPMWQVEPIITREQQSAMDQLAKCEEAEEAAATATNQARETLAEYEAT